MSFHQFSRLPTELRLRIWEFAAFQPRLVVMLTAKGTDDHAMSGCRWATPVPGILHVCHESQTVALKHYKKVHSHGGRYFQINFHVDTLQLCYCVLTDGFSALPARRNMKHLRVVMHTQWSVSTLATRIKGGAFPRLETLDLFVPTLHGMNPFFLRSCYAFGSEWVAIRVIHSATGEYVTNETIGPYLGWREKRAIGCFFPYPTSRLVSVEDQAVCPTQFLGGQASPLEGIDTEPFMWQASLWRTW